jgi:hypothetical protein
MDPQTLRILRNTLYAMKGYAFASKELQEYFLKMYWYFPHDPAKNAEISFSPWEQIYSCKGERTLDLVPDAILLFEYGE